MILVGNIMTEILSATSAAMVVTYSNNQCAKNGEGDLLDHSFANNGK